jgi:hypothetical protein
MHSGIKTHTDFSSLCQIKFQFSTLVVFVSPANCHQPETRAVGHPCNPCNPLNAFLLTKHNISTYESFTHITVFLHVLFAQPSSRTFRLMASSVNPESLLHSEVLKMLTRHFTFAKEIHNHTMIAIQCTQFRKVKMLHQSFS